MNIDAVPDRELIPFRVPIQRVPIQEVATESDLDIALDMLHSVDMPGFIVRSSMIDGELLGHEGLARLIRGKLLPFYVNGSGHYDYKVSYHSPYGEEGLIDSLQNDRGENARSLGIGRFHHDGSGKMADKIHEIHTTVGPKPVDSSKPVGSVTLAHAGLHADTVLAYNINDTIHNDKVDVSIVSYMHHVADLYDGDSVVIRFANSHGGLFHRYDTLQAPRDADVTFVGPSPSQVVEQVSAQRIL